MRFPSKVTSFNDSILSKFPIILNKLKLKDYPVTLLYEELQKEITIEDFVDVLDCLFALEQITLKKEIIHYVKRNTF